MNLDDIMNENIEDVVRVAVMERAKLSDSDMEPDAVETRSKTTPVKGASAASAGTAADSGRAKPRKAETERPQAAVKPTPEKTQAAVKPVPVKTAVTAPSTRSLAVSDDDDDDDDEYVVRGAFAEDAPVGRAHGAAVRETVKKPAFTYRDDDAEDSVRDAGYGDDEDVELQEDEYNKGTKSSIRTLIADYMFFPIAIAIAFLVFYVFPPYIVDGPSMQKTLDDKAFGFGFRYATPERGDIVIVNTGEDGGTGGASFIKRVIGVPGDTIYCVYEEYEYDVTLSDGKIVKAGDPVYRVYLNGEMLYEPYVWFGDNNIARVTDPITLGEDEYFIMGDNRFNSNDSRAFGPIKRSDIKCTMMVFLLGKHNPE